MGTACAPQALCRWPGFRAALQELICDLSDPCSEMGHSTEPEDLQSGSRPQKDTNRSASREVSWYTPLCRGEAADASEPRHTFSSDAQRQRVCAWIGKRNIDRNTVTVAGIFQLYLREVLLPSSDILPCRHVKQAASARCSCSLNQIYQWC